MCIVIACSMRKWLILRALVFITVISLIRQCASEEDEDDDLMPSIACIVFGNRGCSIKCGILCKMYKCETSEPACDGVYCDCHEKFTPLTLSQLQATPSEDLPFKDLLSIKFLRTPVFVPLIKLMRDDPDTKQQVVHFLRTRPGYGKEFKKALMARFPELKLLKRLKPRPLMTEDVGTDVIRAQLATNKPSGWGGWSSLWPGSDAGDAAVFDVNSDANKLRVIDSICGIKSKDDLLHALRMLKNEEKPLYTDVLKHFMLNGLTMPDGTRVIEPVYNLKTMAGYIENDQVLEDLQRMIDEDKRKRLPNTGDDDESNQQPRHIKKKIKRKIRRRKKKTDEDEEADLGNENIPHTVNAVVDDDSSPAEMSKRRIKRRKKKRKSDDSGGALDEAEIPDQHSVAETELWPSSRVSSVIHPKTQPSADISESEDFGGDHHQPLFHTRPNADLERDILEKMYGKILPVRIGRPGFDESTNSGEIASNTPKRDNLKRLKPLDREQGPGEISKKRKPSKPMEEVGEHPKTEEWEAEPNSMAASDEESEMSNSIPTVIVMPTVLDSESEDESKAQLEPDRQSAGHGSSGTSGPSSGWPNPSYKPDQENFSSSNEPDDVLGANGGIVPGVQKLNPGGELFSANDNIPHGVETPRSEGEVDGSESEDEGLDLGAGGKPVSGTPRLEGEADEREDGLNDDNKPDDDNEVDLTESNEVNGDYGTSEIPNLEDHFPGQKHVAHIPTVYTSEPDDVDLDTGTAPNHHDSANSPPGDGNLDASDWEDEENTSPLSIHHPDYVHQAAKVGETLPAIENDEGDWEDEENASLFGIHNPAEAPQAAKAEEALPVGDNDESGWEDEENASPMSLHRPEHSHQAAKAGEALPAKENDESDWEDEENTGPLSTHHPKPAYQVANAGEALSSGENDDSDWEDEEYAGPLSTNHPKLAHQVANAGGASPTGENDDNDWEDEENASPLNLYHPEHTHQAANAGGASPIREDDDSDWEDEENTSPFSTHYPKLTHQAANAGGALPTGENDDSDWEDEENTSPLSTHHPKLAHQAANAGGASPAGENDDSDWEDEENTSPLNLHHPEHTHPVANAGGASPTGENDDNDWEDEENTSPLNLHDPEHSHQVVKVGEALPAGEDDKSDWENEENTDPLSSHHPVQSHPAGRNEDEESGDIFSSENQPFTPKQAAVGLLAPGNDSAHQIGQPLSAEPSDESTFDEASGDVRPLGSGSRHTDSTDNNNQDSEGDPTMLQDDDLDTENSEEDELFPGAMHASQKPITVTSNMPLSGVELDTSDFETSTDEDSLTPHINLPMILTPASRDEEDQPRIIHHPALPVADKLDSKLLPQTLMNVDQDYTDEEDDSLEGDDIHPTTKHKKKRRKKRRKKHGHGSGTDVDLPTGAHNPSDDVTESGEGYFGNLFDRPEDENQLIQHPSADVRQSEEGFSGEDSYFGNLFDNEPGSPTFQDGSHSKNHLGNQFDMPNSAAELGSGASFPNTGIASLPKQTNKPWFDDASSGEGYFGDLFDTPHAIGSLPTNTDPFALSEPELQTDHRVGTGVHHTPHSETTDKNSWDTSDGDDDIEEAPLTSKDKLALGEDLKEVLESDEDMGAFSDVTDPHYKPLDTTPTAHNDGTITGSSNLSPDHPNAKAIDSAPWDDYADNDDEDAKESLTAADKLAFGKDLEEVFGSDEHMLDAFSDMTDAHPKQPGSWSNPHPSGDHADEDLSAPIPYQFPTKPVPVAADKPKESIATLTDPTESENDSSLDRFFDLKHNPSDEVLSVEQPSDANLEDDSSLEFFNLPASKPGGIAEDSDADGDADDNEDDVPYETNPTHAKPAAEAKKKKWTDYVVAPLKQLIHRNNPIKPTADGVNSPSTSVPHNLSTSTPSGWPTSTSGSLPTSISSGLPISMPNGPPSSIPSGLPASVLGSSPISLYGGSPTSQPAGVPKSTLSFPTSVLNGHPTSLANGLPDSMPDGFQPSTLSDLPTAASNGSPESMPGPFSPFDETTSDWSSPAGSSVSQFIDSPVHGSDDSDDEVDHTMTDSGKTANVIPEVDIGQLSPGALGSQNSPSMSAGTLPFTNAASNVTPSAHSPYSELEPARPKIDDIDEQAEHLSNDMKTPTGLSPITDAKNRKKWTDYITEPFNKMIHRNKKDQPTTPVQDHIPQSSPSEKLTPSQKVTAGPDSVNHKGFGSDPHQMDSEGPETDASLESFFNLNTPQGEDDWDARPPTLEDFQSSGPTYEDQEDVSKPVSRTPVTALHDNELDSSEDYVLGLHHPESPMAGESTHFDGGDENPNQELGIPAAVASALPDDVRPSTLGEEVTASYAQGSPPEFDGVPEDQDTEDDVEGDDEINLPPGSLPAADAKKRKKWTDYITEPFNKLIHRNKKDQPTTPIQDHIPQSSPSEKLTSSQKVTAGPDSVNHKGFGSDPHQMDFEGPETDASLESFFNLNTPQVEDDWDARPPTLEDFLSSGPTHEDQEDASKPVSHTPVTALHDNELDSGEDDVLGLHHPESPIASKSTHLNGGDENPNQELGIPAAVASALPDDVRPSTLGEEVTASYAQGSPPEFDGVPEDQDTEDDVEGDEEINMPPGSLPAADAKKRKKWTDYITEPFNKLIHRNKKDQPTTPVQGHPPQSSPAEKLTPSQKVAAGPDSVNHKGFGSDPHQMDFEGPETDASLDSFFNLDIPQVENERDEDHEDASKPISHTPLTALHDDEPYSGDDDPLGPHYLESPMAGESTHFDGGVKNLNQESGIPAAVASALPDVVHPSTLGEESTATDAQGSTSEFDGVSEDKNADDDVVGDEEINLPPGSLPAADAKKRKKWTDYVTEPINKLIHRKPKDQAVAASDSRSGSPLGNSPANHDAATATGGMFPVVSNSKSLLEDKVPSKPASAVDSPTAATPVIPNQHPEEAGSPETDLSLDSFFSLPGHELSDIAADSLKTPSIDDEDVSSPISHTSLRLEDVGFFSAENDFHENPDSLKDSTGWLDEGGGNPSPGKSKLPAFGEDDNEAIDADMVAASSAASSAPAAAAKKKKWTDYIKAPVDKLLHRNTPQNQASPQMVTSPATVSAQPVDQKLVSETGNANSKAPESSTLTASPAIAAHPPTSSPVEANSSPETNASLEQFFNLPAQNDETLHEAHPEEDTSSPIPYSSIPGVDHGYLDAFNGEDLVDMPTIEPIVPVPSFAGSNAETTSSAPATPQPKKPSWREQYSIPSRLPNLTPSTPAAATASSDPVSAHPMPTPASAAEANKKKWTDYVTEPVNKLVHRNQSVGQGAGSAAPGHALPTATEPAKTTPGTPSKKPRSWRDEFNIPVRLTSAMTRPGGSSSSPGLEAANVTPANTGKPTDDLRPAAVSSPGRPTASAKKLSWREQFKIPAIPKVEANGYQMGPDFGRLTGYRGPWN